MLNKYQKTVAFVLVSTMLVAVCSGLEVRAETLDMNKLLASGCTTQESVQTGFGLIRILRW